MKRLLITLLVFIPVYTVVYADSKLTALGNDTSPISTDILYLVSDPGGTPTSKKVTVGNLLAGSTNYATDHWPSGISTMTMTIPTPFGLNTSTVAASTIAVTGKIDVGRNQSNWSSSGYALSVNPSITEASIGIGNYVYLTDGSKLQLLIPTGAALQTTGSLMQIQHVPLEVDTNLTAQSNVTFSNMTTGVVQSDSGGGLTSSYVSLSSAVVGTLPVANGGTGNTSATDDNVLIGNGSGFDLKSIPNCTDITGQHLNYTAASNSLTCGSSGSGGGGGGASTLGVYSNGVLISSPTGALNAKWPIYSTLEGSTTADFNLGAVSLSTGTMGSLPTNSLSGMISLSTQITGILPDTNKNATSLSSGTVGSLPTNSLSGKISLSTQVTGVLPITSLDSLVSLSTGVTSSLPTNSLSGKISLSTQVTGVLPVSSLDSLISLSTGVTSSLPTNSLSGKISPSTGIASGSLSATVLVSSLAAVTTAGSYGSSTISPTITFNAQGQIISASSNTISTSGGGGGYAVEPATVAFRLNQGMTASTGTFTLGITASSATFTSTCTWSSVSTMTYTGVSIQISTSTNGIMGTATLSGGTVTVTNGKCTANSFIFISDAGNGAANIGTLSYSATTGSFTIKSTNVLDASPVTWLLLEPVP